jgi:hypothetical protein
MPMPTLSDALTQPARAVALLDEHLVTDPDGVAAFFENIFRHRGLFGHGSWALAHWERWARDRGFEPPPPGPRRRSKKTRAADVT